jgi:hypothetical protein
VLVTVVNTLEVVSWAEPELSPDVALLGAVIESLIRFDDSPGNAVEDVARTLVN